MRVPANALGRARNEMQPAFVERSVHHSDLLFTELHILASRILRESALIPVV